MQKLILKSIIFLIILFGIIYKIDNYFVKDQAAFIKHHFFYKEKKNSLDLLIFGDSHTYCGISSDIIKAKTGLKTFNYGLAGINFTEIYFNLLEALEYQKPKLVIIECYPMIGVGQEKEYLDDNGKIKRRYNFSLEGKKIGLNKFKEARLSIPNYNVLKTFNIFKYHENWSDLKEVSNVLNRYTKKSLDYPPFKDSAKDIVFMSEQIAKKFSTKKFNDSIYLSEDHRIIMNKIINLSKDKKFKLLFVTVPFYETYYAKTKDKFNSIEKEISNVLNSDINIKMLDINPKVKLDKTNFLGGNIKSYNYNNQHLNYKGNIKVSNIISNYINQTYSFTNPKNNFKTPQDIFYNYTKSIDETQFEGELLKTSKNINSKFEGTLEEANASEKNETNELKFCYEFDNPIWYKNSIKITTNSMISPDGMKAAEKIKGVGNKNGYISQIIHKKTGVFKWSIWLKGTGTTEIVLQENGDDYTKYGTHKIELTPNWCQYTLIASKENDLNQLRCVISGIKDSDVLYSWGGKLTQIENSKLINEIIVPKNVSTVKIKGWMHLNNGSIKNKFIALKKDNEFNYVSLRHQIKNIKDNSYVFEIQKSILEKGKYEIFQIAMSDKNIFYIKKLKNNIIIK